MIKLATFLCVLFLMMPFAYSQEAQTRVAKVDYSKIEDLLESVVLAHPDNIELGERFRAKVKKSEEAQEKMQTAIMKGEKIDAMAASLNSVHGSRESKKVAVLCEKHLLQLIETTLKGKYDIVFKEDFRSSLLFTKVAIDDVSAILKQELLKQLPPKND